MANNLSKILDDRKLLAIELLAEGEKTKVEIANQCGVARNTIYEWMDNPDFKAELDRRLQGRKVLVEKMIDGKLESAISLLWRHALTTENARVKAQSLQYIIDRGLGKPTSKHEIEDNTDTDKMDQDVLKDELAEFEKELSDNKEEK